MTTIYTKLQEARSRLHNMELKKSGYNSFSKYHYFELGDFLPQIQKIFNDVGLCGCTDFSCTDKAILFIYNNDDGNSIVFSSPLADAGVKGATAIQAVGSAITYQRRYLWMQALEITENDFVDSLDQKDKKPPDAKPTPNEWKQIYKESLLSAQTLGGLAEAWEKIPKENKVQELINIKDKRKEGLTPLGQKIQESTSKDMLYRVCENLTDGQEEEYSGLIQAKLDGFQIPGENK
jgi:hypothetical protein